MESLGVIDVGLRQIVRDPSSVRSNPRLTGFAEASIVVGVVKRVQDRLVDRDRRRERVSRFKRRSPFEPIPIEGVRLVPVELKFNVIGFASAAPAASAMTAAKVSIPRCLFIFVCPRELSTSTKP
jgi:hypothetical protein